MGRECRPSLSVGPCIVVLARNWFCDKNKHVGLCGYGNLALVELIVFVDFTVLGHFMNGSAFNNKLIFLAHNIDFLSYIVTL